MSSMGGFPFKGKGIGKKGSGFGATSKSRSKRISKAELKKEAKEKKAEWELASTTRRTKKPADSTKKSLKDLMASMKATSFFAKPTENLAILKVSILK